MKYALDPNGDYYSKSDIANLFKRPVSFVNKLLDLDMPCIIVCRNLLIPKEAFWKWIGTEVQSGERIITIRQMAKELGVSNASAYRIKNRLPKSIVINVGRQCFVLKNALSQYMQHESITNKGGKL